MKIHLVLGFVNHEGSVVYEAYELISDAENAVSMYNQELKDEPEHHGIRHDMWRDNFSLKGASHNDEFFVKDIELNGEFG